MTENKKKKELDNTVLILNEVLSKYNDRDDIKELFERSEKLVEKRNLK